MKKYFFLFSAIIFLMFTSCKKTAVDSTNLKTFQSSINDLESSLTTIRQIKFNEALYILKTFGVEGNDDISKLKALSKLLEGKKVPQIFAMADKVAQDNNVEWKSSGPPSLGEMNIFGPENATEKDPNEIEANSLSITTTPIAIDSILGAKALQIVPRLLDNSGKPISFKNAALETILEVSSNGNKLLTSKNLMQNNNFKGFTLRFASLPKNKITDDKIEIKITVKSSKKTYQMIKTGVPVNTKSLLEPTVIKPDSLQTASQSSAIIDPNSATTPSTVTATNPKTTVQKFLNNLGSQNLKGAYEVSDNPNWGNFDQFSNPNSGFGAVKNLNVNSISEKNKTDNNASVNANYSVTDKNGNTVALDVTYGLKNINGTWKISSYKINSSQKK
ncbi:hypothetical protein [Halpernia sp.]|uniref:hypothetical protein n=1 Tax=Halpernia sp. TaxID=2782209 RepID=UPI003A928B50